MRNVIGCTCQHQQHWPSYHVTASTLSLLVRCVSCALQLEAALAEAEEAVRTAEERMQQLRAELLLREENYNKHFKNGGAGAMECRQWADVLIWLTRT